jgi:outer membrane protein TolC
MGNQFRHTVVGACALGFAAAVSAAGQTPTLTLGDLYREIARANPQVNAARSAARASEARVPGSRRPPDPQMQIGLMNYSIPSFAPMPGIGMAQLQVMQMLPLGGKLGLAGVVAQGRASASQHRVADVVWDVRGKAAMAFYDRYLTDRSLDIDRETVRLLQDIEHVAATMYRVGEGRQADVLRAQVEIARMIEDTVRMRTMQTIMIARLNALVNSDVETLPRTVVLPTFPDTLPGIGWLDSLASINRPMIKAAVDELSSATAAVRLAKKEIWPDVQVGLQYAQQGGEMGVERMASLMLGASVPLFARDKQYRMRDEAAAMRQMASDDLAAMRLDTRARVAEAHATLTQARKLAALYRTTILPQAEATVASAFAAYRVGRVDFMTLLDARMAVNKYRKDLERLHAEEGKAWADLEMLTGHDLIDSNTTGIRDGAK